MAGTENEEEKLRKEADADGKIEVSLEEPADDDEELEASDEQPEQGKPQQPSRSEKKKQRGQNLVRQAKEEAEAARREAAELRGRIEELARAQQRPQQQPQTQQSDPLETELKGLQSEFTAYNQRLSAAQQAAQSAQRPMTQEEIDKWNGEAWALQERMADLNYRRAAKRHEKPGVTAEQIQAQTLVTQVQSKHADLFQHERGSKLFEAQWRLELAEGKPDTWETMDAAADKVRQRLGMTPRGGRPAPTAATRARFSAQSQSAGSAGDDSDTKPMVFDKNLQKMANALYSHIKDPKKRYEMYAKKVGKELRKEGLA